MLLANRELREDPIAKHIPDFGANGKDTITVRQLLTHQGGLIPDNALSDYDDGAQEAFRRIYALQSHVEPGTKFVYTDVGYIVLGELIRQVTGEDDGVSVSFDCDSPELDDALGTKTTDFGLVLGGGFEFLFSRLTVQLDARYNLGLTNLYDTADASELSQG